MKSIPVGTVANTGNMSSTIHFGETLYLITDPDPAWFQQSPYDHPECSKCGGELVFTFPPRTDPRTAGFAGSYSVPTGVRCNCFVADSCLVRNPVRVIPVSNLRLTNGEPNP
jgi:hypothetical protein